MNYNNSNQRVEVIFLNVLTALYETYIRCENSGLVDSTTDLNIKPVLLPVYHTNKRSNNGKDILEILLDENGNFISAKYLEKNDIIIFPVTEDSVSRSSGVSPHPIVDELSYVTNLFSKPKNQEYLKGLKRWIEFNSNMEKNETLQSIYSYLADGKLVEDIINFLYPRANYRLNGNKIEITYKEEQYSLTSKDFITFKIQTKAGRDISISESVSLHRNYIDFVNYEISHYKQSICNISGNEMYCTRKHRGLMGNAKLISVSNNKETHIGRFQDGTAITQIGYETSQKIHNMLKYLLENQKTAQKLDSTSYIVTWSSAGIDDFDLDITRGEDFSELDAIGLGFLLDSSETSGIYKIKAEKSKFLNNYIKGKVTNQKSEVIKNLDQEHFFVLIVDKVSNGRISIKYFRDIYLGELIERVSEWYQFNNWEYGFGKNKKVRTPSLSLITTITHGNYQLGSKKIELNKDNLRKVTIEKLLPCVVEGKKIPLDVVTKVIVNISRRMSYRDYYSWQTLLSTSCAVLKKYKWDYFGKEVTIELNEKNMSRDYLYGRLLAVFEAIEISATNSDKVTNAEKLWSLFIQSPDKTYLKLSEKTNPYLIRLKRTRKHLYDYYDSMLTDLSTKIEESLSFSKNSNKKLNEDFIFGYYAQRKNIYTKKFSEGGNRK